MEFIDTCAFLGRTTSKRYAFAAAAEMADVLRRYGLAKAVVYHLYAEQFDATVGNRMLLDEVAGFPQLLPQFIVNIPAEKTPPDAFIDQMLKSGVRSARLSPRAQNYLLMNWTADDWLGAFERRAIPVWLDFSQTSWEQLEYVCSSFPSLRLVVTGLHYNEHQMLFPFLRRYSQVYMGLHKYDVLNALKKLCNEFGDERLLYGAGLPELDPGAWKCYLERSGLSQSSIERIAGGNCMRLLREAGGKAE